MLCGPLSLELPMELCEKKKKKYGYTQCPEILIYLEQSSETCTVKNVQLILIFRSIWNPEHQCTYESCRDLVKCRFCLRRAGEGPENLHF